MFLNKQQVDFKFKLTVGYKNKRFRLLGSFRWSSSICTGTLHDPVRYRSEDSWVGPPGVNCPQPGLSAFVRYV